MQQQYPNAYHSDQRYGRLLSPSRFVVILDGFLFIFAIIKLSMPLI